MKTIQEIFATNPDLLEQKEVKELLDEFKKQMSQMKKRHLKYQSDITELILNSEHFRKNGTTSDKVIEQIFNLK